MLFSGELAAGTSSASCASAAAAATAAGHAAAAAQYGMIRRVASAGVGPAPRPTNRLLLEAPFQSSTSPRARAAVVCAAAVRRRRRIYDGDDGEEQLAAQLRKREEVTHYVRGVEPQEVEAFLQEAPPMVVQAMKQTVANMVGTLPPQHFSVNISTVAESLASLMQTMLRTGYLLRGVQYQLELELALQTAAASMMHPPHPQATSACPSPAAAAPPPPIQPAAALQGGVSAPAVSSILLTPPPAVQGAGFVPVTDDSAHASGTQTPPQPVIPEIIVSAAADPNEATAAHAAQGTGGPLASIDTGTSISVEARSVGEGRQGASGASLTVGANGTASSSMTPITASVGASISTPGNHTTPGSNTPSITTAPTASTTSTTTTTTSSTALEVRGWSAPEDQYAPGVQLSRVEGDALRWHPQHGLERLPAQHYIRLLEERVSALQRQLAEQQQQQQQLAAQQQQQAQQQAWGVAGGFQAYPAAGAGGAAAAMAAAAAVLAAGNHGVGEAQGGAAANPVLTYLRGLEPKAVAALGTCGPEVSDAMSLFVARLMGTTEREQLRQMTSEFSSVELSKLMFWLLVVGWSLRSMEVRLEVEESFGNA